MTWFVNLKLSRKFILCFLIMALLAAVISFVGIRDILVLNNEAKALYESNLLGVQYAENAALSFQWFRYNLAMLAVQDSPDTIFEYRNRVDEQFQNVQAGLNAYQDLIETDTQRQLFSRVQSHWEAYTAVRSAMFNAVNKTTKDKIAIISLYTDISDSLHDAFTKLIDYEITSAKEKADENNAVAMRAVIIEAAVLVVAVAIAILLGSYVSYVTGRPIVRSVEVAERLAIGDIDVKELITERSKKRRDEIGQLCVAFDKLVDATASQVKAAEYLAKGDLTKDMAIRSEQDVLGRSLQAVIDNLNEITASVIATANQVAAGASMISDSSMALSDGATRQASAIEELTASIEEIAAQTANNAENAGKANAFAAQTKETAQKGNAQMDAMLSAMDAISSSSKNISKIIKVIDDIAFQTNILSLNAAVEAARAGQHGKGFAVVAEEVRTLAKRSANAAHETTEMIEDSLRNIKAGTRIAQETADALNQIVTEISNVAELVEAIAKASHEQALGIENINQGVAQVSQVVQSNAASAEESAAASEELSTQAQQLKELLKVFETKQGVSSRLSEKSFSPALSPRESARLSPAGSHDKY